MKKTVAISLFIFFAAVVALLVAGLLKYQPAGSDNPSNSSLTTTSTSSTTQDITQNLPPGVTLALNMAEITRHNKTSDCWLLISGKVYNVTAYISSHPGGAGAITQNCGKDATTAFQTKGGGGNNHSASAYNLLASYYIGDLNQTVGQQQTQNNAAPANLNTSVGAENEQEYEDD